MSHSKTVNSLSHDNTNNTIEKMEYFESNNDEFYEYNIFNEYKEYMLKPITQSHIRSKIHELKNLAKSLKKMRIHEDDDKLNSILNIYDKDIEYFKSEKTNLYQKESVYAPQYLQKNNQKQINSPQKSINNSDNKKGNKKNSSNNNSEEYMMNENSDSSLELDLDKKKTSNFSTNHPNIIISQNLNHHTKKDDLILGLDYYDDSYGYIDNNSNVKSHDFQTEKQNLLGNDKLISLVTNLQFFLSQNLRETLELKEIIKQAPDNNAYNVLSTTKKNLNLLNETWTNSKNDDKNILQAFETNQISAKTGRFGTKNNNQLRSMSYNGVVDYEKNIFTNQTDRLIGKLQTLSNQYEELKNTILNYPNNLNLLKNALKAGHVKLSEIITNDFDLTLMTIDEIELRYKMTTKYLILLTSALYIYDNNNESIINDLIKPKHEIYYSDIEDITYLDIPESCIYIVRLKDKYVNDINPIDKKLIKTNMHNNASGSNTYSPYNKARLFAMDSINKAFILLKIDNPKELNIWDYYFFFINYKIYYFTSKNSFYLCNYDNINLVKQFYVQYIIDEYYNHRRHPKIIKDSLNNSIRNYHHKKPNSKSSSSISSTVNSPPIFHDKDNENRFSFSKPPKKKMIYLSNNNTSNSNNNSDSNTINNNSPHTNNQSNNNSNLNKFNTPRNINPNATANITDRQNDDDDLNDLIITEEKNNLMPIQAQSMIIKHNDNINNPSNTNNNYIKDNNDIILYLKQGEMFLKYGKWGKPHTKLIFMTDNMAYLQWRKIKSDHNKPKKDNDNNIKKSIAIKSILRIDEYNQSTFFEKKNIDDKIKRLSFSIIAPKRELNLRATNHQIKNKFIEALKILLNNPANPQILIVYIVLFRQKYVIKICLFLFYFLKFVF